MTRCLIGHSGFVGGNLLAQAPFDETYNSSNIQAIRGKQFAEIWCAGVSAVKWQANKFPEEDWQGIQRLLEALSSVRAERFVLISTIDVYKSPLGVNEDTPIETEGHHPYGLHRRTVEEVIAQRFPVHHIIRLPGLFGRGLKKNIIYDFLHGNQVENIHADAVFQFYGLDDLTRHIRLAIEHALPLINFATEPVSVREVAQHAFGIDFVNQPFPDPPRYDMQTRYGALFGSPTPYLFSKAEVLGQIADFVRRTREDGKS